MTQIGLKSIEERGSGLKVVQSEPMVHYQLVTDEPLDLVEELYFQVLFELEQVLHLEICSMFVDIPLSEQAQRFASRIKEPLYVQLSMNFDSTTGIEEGICSLLTTVA